MQLLKKIPFFLFLLPVFFCLHGWMENYGYIDFKEVLVLAAGISLWLGLLFLLIFLLFKRDYVFSALVSFFIGLWYLFFGSIVDWLRSIDWLFFLSSYTWLLPFLLIITIIWMVILKKKKKLQPRLLYYFNILLIVYCCIDGFLLLQKSVVQGNKHTVSTAAIFDTSKAVQKPNVYFLLFDEYAGYKSLRDSFDFNNDRLYSYFKEKEFSVLPLFSNYDYTLFSMSSIVNMQYVNKDYDPAGIVQRDLQRRSSEIRHGAVFDIFLSMGYRLQNYSVFDIGDQHGINGSNSFLPVHAVLLTDKILHNRIMRTSGWLFKTGKFAVAAVRKKYLFEHDNNNQAVERLVLQSAREKKNRPTFCYGHFMLPHWPFFKDSTGKYRPDSVITNERNANDQSLYLPYLKYTNDVIRKLVDSISLYDPQSVILIMSDHGFRSYPDRGFQPFVFDNMAALRLPGRVYPVYKDQWSNVNVFRYLFNAEFGQKIPYLGDSSIVLKYK